MGHEVYGSIVSLGSSFANSDVYDGKLTQEGGERIKGYKELKVGQKVRKHIRTSTPRASADINEFNPIIGYFNLLNKLYGMRVRLTFSLHPSSLAPSFWLDD